MPYITHTRQAWTYCNIYQNHMVRPAELQNLSEQNMIDKIVEEKVVDYLVLENLDGPAYLDYHFCLKISEWPANIKVFIS